MRSLRFVLALLPLWHCSTPTSAPADAGAGSAPPLACAAIFDCADACADEPCTDVCLARGSSDAQQSALALARCYTDNACADATCLQTNCQGEIDTCFAQGQPTGTPLAGGSTTPGSVPAELAGSWVHAAWGQTERFTLEADGTGSYQSGITSTTTCALTQNTTWDGTVVVDATTITIYGTNVTYTRLQCGLKTTTTNPPQTMRFTYTYDAATDALSVIDNGCAASYPDSPSSQSLYCKNAYTRE